MAGLGQPVAPSASVPETTPVSPVWWRCRRTVRSLPLPHDSIMISVRMDVAVAVMATTGEGDAAVESRGRLISMLVKGTTIPRIFRFVVVMENTGLPELVSPARVQSASAVAQEEW